MNNSKRRLYEIAPLRGGGPNESPPVKTRSTRREVVSISNPYMNKMVKVTDGVFKGIQGKVLSVEARGWMIIDSPDLPKGQKIHSRYCEMVNEEDRSNLLEIYSKRGCRLPNIVRDRQQENQHQMKKNNSNIPQQKGSPTLDSANSNIHEDDTLDIKPKSSPSDTLIESSGLKYNDVARKKNRRLSRVRSTSPVALPNEKEADNLIVFPCSDNRDTRVEIPSTLKILTEFPPPKRMRYSKKNPPPRDPILPPIIINSDDNRVPDSLRIFPRDLKVEIYNRKTGRILKGDDAVEIRDLPSFLRENAHCEPLIPSPDMFIDDDIVSPSQIFSREARSSRNTRINSIIAPQTRSRNSLVKGKKVNVISGKYEGSKGVIKSCLPGDFYLVSGIKIRDDIDVVIDSKNLCLIDTEERIHNDETDDEAFDAIDSTHRITLTGPERENHGLNLDNEMNMTNEEHRQCRMKELGAERQRILKMIVSKTDADDYYATKS